MLLGVLAVFSPYSSSAFADKLLLQSTTSTLNSGLYDAVLQNFIKTQVLLFMWWLLAQAKRWLMVAAVMVMRFYPFNRR